MSLETLSKIELEVLDLIGKVQKYPKGSFVVLTTSREHIGYYEVCYYDKKGIKDKNGVFLNMEDPSSDMKKMTKEQVEEFVKPFDNAGLIDLVPSTWIVPKGVVPCPHQDGWVFGK